MLVITSKKTKSIVIMTQALNQPHPPKKKVEIILSKMILVLLFWKNASPFPIESYTYAIFFITFFLFLIYFLITII